MNKCACFSIEQWFEANWRGHTSLQHHFLVSECSRNMTKSDYKKTETEIFFRSPHAVLLGIYFILHRIYLFLVKSATSISPGANITPGSGWPMSGLGLFHWPAVCRGYNLAPLKTDFPLSPGKLSDTTYWNLVEFVANARLAESSHKVAYSKCGQCNSSFSTGGARGQ